MRKLIPVILVLALVLVLSGCISNDPVNVEQKETKDLADVVTIAKIETLPAAPVYNDRTFKLYVTLKNNDKGKTVNYVDVGVFDSSVFTLLSGDTRYVGDILPQGEKVVSFDLKAPSYEKLAGVETDGTISFRVTYYFESVSAYDVSVVDENEIEKQAQAGSSIHILSNKIIGSGPVRIYPQLVGSDKGYLINGTTGSISITLKNEGSGIVRDSKIETGKLSVEFPGDFRVTPPKFKEYVTANFISGNAIANPRSCSDYCHNDMGYGDSTYDVSAQTSSSDICYQSYSCSGGNTCSYGCKKLSIRPDYSENDDIFAGESCYCVKVANCDCGSGGTQHCSSTGCAAGGTGSATTSTVVSVTTSSSSTVPIHVTPPGEVDRDYFDCPGNKCTNTKSSLDVVGKESIPFLFDITSPSTVSIYKTYMIQATVGYFYELRGSTTVKVKLFENNNP
jgi:hypothetical protein